MFSMYQFLFGIIFCGLLANADINLQCYLHDQPVPFNVDICQTVYFEAINTIYLFPTFTDHNYEIYKWNISSSSSWFERITFTPPTENLSFWSTTNNAVVVNNRAYFIGMVDVIANHSDVAICIPQDEVYIFDPTNDSFMIAENIMHPHYRTEENCLTTNGSHIFMIGAPVRKNESWIAPWPLWKECIMWLNAHGNSLVQMYDVYNNTWYHEWIYVPSLQYGYSGQSCVMIKDEIFLFGGQTRKEPERSDLTYTLASNQYYKYLWPGNWTFLGNKSEATRYSTAAYNDELIFVIGGEICENNCHPLTCHYPCVCDSWRTPTYSATVDIFNVSSEKIVDAYYLDWNVGSVKPTALTINNTLYIFDNNVLHICEILVMPDTTQTETTMIKPSETEPKVTEPKVTEPKVTEPKVTEEKVTEPLRTRTTEMGHRNKNTSRQKNVDVYTIVVVVVCCCIGIIAIMLFIVYCTKKRKRGYIKTNQTDIDHEAVDVQVQNTIK